MERVARGDIPPKIVDTYCGAFDSLKCNLNLALDNIAALSADEACRRRLRRGGCGSAQLGATLGGGGQGNQGIDRRLGGDNRERQQTGADGEPNPGSGAGSVKKVTDIMAEIAAASGEQSADIEQVNRSVSQLDTVTEQNAALVKQVAAAAVSLEGRANDLSATVARFRFATAAAERKALARTKPAGIPAARATKGEWAGF